MSHKALAFSICKQIGNRELYVPPQGSGPAPGCPSSSPAMPAGAPALNSASPGALARVFFACCRDKFNGRHNIRRTHAAINLSLQSSCVCCAQKVVRALPPCPLGISWRFVHTAVAFGAWQRKWLLLIEPLHLYGHFASSPSSTCFW
jgi:hypothetical protein